MFYIVATPIGNLKDISIRAIETLKSCDYILCEDTRTSRVLLNNYEIDKPLVSYHKFNEKEKCDKIYNDLINGKDICLISDAGMPGISDPGAVIINYLKEKQYNNYTVIPGASALINAQVLSGFPAPFVFVGFLPEKTKDRKSILQKVADSTFTSVFYVSPHEIDKFFKTCLDSLGDREVCVAREITKKFEEVVFTTLKQGYTSVVKGEFVCVIKGKEQDVAVSDDAIIAEFQILINTHSNKDAVSIICEKYNLKKNYVYSLCVK